MLFQKDNVDKKAISNFIMGRILRYSASLKAKVVDDEVRFKGGKTISAGDLTKFCVVGKIGEERTVGDMEPVWAVKDDNLRLNGNVINMLPCIAMAIPIISNIVNISVEDSESTVVNFGARVDYSKVSDDGYKQLLSMMNMYNSMLVTNPIYKSVEWSTFSEKILLATATGISFVASALIDCVYKNGFLGTGIEILDDFFTQGDTPVFTDVKSYKDDNGMICRISATERVAVCITLLWLCRLYQMLDGSYKKFDAKCDFYKKILFQYIGNDDFAQSLIRGEFEYHAAAKINGVTVKRIDNDTIYLLKHMYKCRSDIMSPDYILDIKYYNCHTLDLAASMYDVAAGNKRACLETIRERDDIDKHSKELEYQVTSLNAKLTSAKEESERITETYERQLSSLNSTISQKDSIIRSLREELDLLKSDMFSYYSDESVDEEDEKSIVPIEDCVSLINEYKIACIGGEYQFLQKLSEYGVVSVNQINATNMVGSFDFYCLLTKFVSHKLVFAARASFDMNDRLFYYNGTNIEMFIRAAYKFITEWFDK